MSSSSVRSAAQLGTTVFASACTRRRSAWGSGRRLRADLCPAITERLLSSSREVRAKLARHGQEVEEALKLVAGVKGGGDREQRRAERRAGAEPLRLWGDFESR